MRTPTREFDVTGYEREPAPTEIAGLLVALALLFAAAVLLT